MQSLHYANMIIDGQSVLIPQKDVRHIELVDNIESQESDDHGHILGEIDHQKLRWPVYALNSELAFADGLPEHCRFVVCISSEGKMMGLACDMVSNMELDAEFVPKDLPQMMQAQNSPIHALLYRDKQIHCVSDSKSLTDYLLRMEG